LYRPRFEAMTQAVKMQLYFSSMKNAKRTEIQPPAVAHPQHEVRNPAVIDKFYKQLLNNFGYGHTTKTTGC
jgi:hypothetical protein